MTDSAGVAFREDDAAVVLTFEVEHSFVEFDDAVFIVL
jgi:hypothetical protein